MIKHPSKRQKKELTCPIIKLPKDIIILILNALFPKTKTMFNFINCCKTLRQFELENYYVLSKMILKRSIRHEIGDIRIIRFQYCIRYCCLSIVTNTSLITDKQQLEIMSDGRIIQPHPIRKGNIYELELFITALQYGLWEISSQLLIICQVENTLKAVKCFANIIPSLPYSLEGKTMIIKGSDFKHWIDSDTYCEDIFFH